ncbi:MAG TPA: exodeoxyribonuclease VII small subunit [Candidatus Sumerlaeota bacterium]|nr:exodeoxyribonuclease VII small subunit [Candidatus Sumerlaeota bacterium]HPS00357.1 exodeoxyribonuclease VII small subunit [Candidatus Sumerlaeota bacterium]
MTNAKSFEQNLKALEKIVEKLESGSVSLDESIELFQKGRVLGRACEKRLREAELKIQQLIEHPDGDLQTADFEVEDSEDSADEEGGAG